MDTPGGSKIAPRLEKSISSLGSKSEIKGCVLFLITTDLKLLKQCFVVFLQHFLPWL
jgi:hypothetical protein